MVGRPIVKCRDIMEKIQNLFNKGQIKNKTIAGLKASAVSVMMVSHSDASSKLEERKGDKEEKLKKLRSSHMRRCRSHVKKK